MIFCYLCVDVSSSRMFFILLWFSISLLGVMFYYPNCWCLVIFDMLSCHIFADVSPSHIFFFLCFAIAYVFHPTLILDIIVRCNVSSSCLIFCYHADVLSSYLSLCCHAMFCHPFLLLYHCYWCFVILFDVLPSWLLLLSS